MYGPVRTVVWEGRSCEAPPYPDRSDFVLWPRAAEIRRCSKSAAIRGKAAVAPNAVGRQPVTQSGMCPRLRPLISIKAKKMELDID